MSQKYGHCPAPSCERRLLPGRSPHGLCPHHEEFLETLLFLLHRIKVEPGQTKAGLILPGSPKFKVASGGGRK